MLFQSGVFCVFEHVFVFAWWLLYVYVLGDVLDFVIVLFQSVVFKYILVYSGWGGGGGAVVHIRKTYRYTPIKLLRGAKEVARDVWEFQRSPSRLLSSIVKSMFILGDKHATTNLDNYGL